jgi:hypothetical protein
MQEPNPIHLLPVMISEKFPPIKKGDDFVESVCNDFHSFRGSKQAQRPDAIFANGFHTWAVMQATLVYSTGPVCHFFLAISQRLTDEWKYRSVITFQSISKSQLSVREALQTCHHT